MVHRRHGGFIGLFEPDVRRGIPALTVAGSDGIPPRRWPPPEPQCARAVPPRGRGRPTRSLRSAPAHGVRRERHAGAARGRTPARRGEARHAGRKRGEPRLQETQVEGRRVVEVQAPDQGRERRRGLGRLDRLRRRPATIWTGRRRRGRQRRRGRPAPRCREPGGLSLYQTAGRISRCDGQTVRLFERRFDFAARRWKPVAPPLPPADGPGHRGPAGRIARCRRAGPASPFPSPRARPRRSTPLRPSEVSHLVAPLALNDGDPETVWAEGDAGDGRGEVLTARSGTAGQAVVGLRVLPGDTRSPARFAARARARGAAGGAGAGSRPALRGDARGRRAVGAGELPQAVLDPPAPTGRLVLRDRRRAGGDARPRSEAAVDVGLGRHRRVHRPRRGKGPRAPRGGARGARLRAAGGRRRGRGDARPCPAWRLLWGGRRGQPWTASWTRWGGWRRRGRCPTEQSRPLAAALPRGAAGGVPGAGAPAPAAAGAPARAADRAALPPCCGTPRPRPRSGPARRAPWQPSPPGSPGGLDGPRGAAGTGPAGAAGRAARPVRRGAGGHRRRRPVGPARQPRRVRRPGARTSSGCWARWQADPARARRQRWGACWSDLARRPERGVRGPGAGPDGARHLARRGSAGPARPRACGRRPTPPCGWWRSARWPPGAEAAARPGAASGHRRRRPGRAAGGGRGGGGARATGRRRRC